MSRRFYREVSVTAENGVALDNRPLKTPRKQSLRLPTLTLAEAIAAEWRAQGSKVDPCSMLLTRLANTAIDRVGAERPRIAAEIVEFAGCDLVCYRAEGPPRLIARQTAAWDPVVDWARHDLDAPFVVTTGVVHVQQPEAALRAFRSHIAAMSDFAIAALHNLTTLTGSALLSAMLEAQAIAPDAVWAAAHVDEDFQIEEWGEDTDAAERHARRHAEFQACCRFLQLLH
jgi:chaperone required for assembly of F1-ATPase